ncbi:MAG TPA: hypothetical protein VEJ63_12120 [Planctomycetota bacterium]|nr:hypothetical protein [Planctomycetota bacterium]
MMQRVLTLFGIDAAVWPLLLARVWAILAGPVSIVLIALFLNPSEQGFYYTFLSLVALQNLFELGLSIVIINTVSHEWAKLSLLPDGSIGGDGAALSRLVSIGRFVFKWYIVAGLLFIVTVGAAGLYFLGSRADAVADWQAPWIALTVLTGLLFVMLPLNAVLEGCNQVAAVNRFRLSQAVVGSAVFWLVLCLGGGLWACVANAAFNLLRELYLVCARYGRFFKTFLNQPAGPVVDWRTELWPRQWRLGVQGLFSYFITSIYTPVLFAFWGPVAAGQMGMTQQIISAIQLLCSSWLQARTPALGILAANRDHETLDREWRRLLLLSSSVLAALYIVFIAAVCVARAQQVELITRLLPPLEITLFIGAAIATHFIGAMAIYVRLFKAEPFLICGIVTAVVNGALAFAAGSRHGPLGLAVAACLQMTLFSLPWIFLIFVAHRKRVRTIQPVNEPAVLEA